MAVDLEILEHIQGMRGGLRPALRAVADAVLQRPELVRNRSISELADLYGVSEASISRFVRAIGLPGYRAFQLRMAIEVASASNMPNQGPDEGHIYENIGRQDTAGSILTKVAHRISDLSRACLSTLDTRALEQAAALIREAPVIYLFAAGLSSLAAENAMLRFARIGKPAVFHRDRNNQLLAAASIPSGGVALAISDSGRTQQTVAALASARQCGARGVAMTAFADSHLARQADVTLITPAGYMPAGEEPIYESMVSKFGQLIAIDILYSLVAVQDFDASAQAVQHGDAIIRASRSMRRANDAD